MAIDLNALRSENDKLTNAKQGNYLDNFVQTPEGSGNVVLRLLPTPDATHGFYYGTRTHKINNKNVHCPCTENPTTGKWDGHCPICNHYRDLWKQSDAADPQTAEALQAQARNIKANARFYYNCVVRSVLNKDGSSSKNVGPKIFSAGVKLHSKILRSICGDPAKYEDPLGDVTDYAQGRDLAAIKTVVGSGRDSFPNWDASKFLGVTKAGTKDEWEQWTKNLHDLAALRKVLPQDELAKEVRIFRGLETEEPEGIPSPANQPVTVIPKKKPQPEFEPDEDFLLKLRSM